MPLPPIYQMLEDYYYQPSNTEEKASVNYSKHPENVLVFKTGIYLSSKSMMWNLDKDWRKLGILLIEA